MRIYIIEDDITVISILEDIVETPPTPPLFYMASWPPTRT